MRSAAPSSPPPEETLPVRSASEGLDAQGMLSALSRLEKHGLNAGFQCDVDSLRPAEWDAVAAEFDDLNYDQVARFSMGQWGHPTSHLLLRRQGTPVAGARAAIIKLPGFSRGLAFLRFGPFWRRRGQTADIAIYRAVIGALVQEYCIRRGHLLTVIPRPHPEFYSRECDVLSEFGFSLRRDFHDPNRYIVDLSLDEETQLRSLEQKWRYNLRQALGNGFDIRLAETEADIRAFQALHAGMVTRKGFYNADKVHLLPELASELPDPLRPRIVLASYQGRVVVGATIAILGDTAYYVYGGSDHASLSLKGGYALQWWIIRWLASQKVRSYDLGGEGGEQGLRQFKKGLVGKRGVVVRMNGEYDYWTRPSARTGADVIYGVRAMQRIIRRWRYRT